jgi:hypothetical protein
MLTRLVFTLGGCLAIAACGTDSTTVTGPTPTPIATIGMWRMQSFDARAVPAAYAEFFDEPVGDRIVHHVEIRLDSAVKELRADSTYVRRYYFSELQDGVVAYRYQWGDHGRFSIDGATPARITLTSEYIQNLSAAGHVSAAGAIELSEPLWLGEENRNTVWTKR